MVHTGRTIRVGTRGSALALAQTRAVIAAAANVHPDDVFEEVVIHTTGDVRSYDPHLGDGIFVKEIQAALVEGRIDAAVHSLKDLPTEPAKGTEIAAITVREDARDGIVGATLAVLPQGARVGTGSSRRSAQLKATRPDLVTVGIRGNVNTRIAKVGTEVDAVVLAMAGLNRLGLEADEVLPYEVVMPAPGQGALAIETRQGDETSRWFAHLHDEHTRAAVVAERVVLSKLGGGCLLPVAAYARVEEGDLLLDARVVSPDGMQDLKASSRGSVDKPLAVARTVANQLISSGAREVLAAHG